MNKTAGYFQHSATRASNLARSSSSPPLTIPKEPAKKKQGRPLGSTSIGSTG